MFQVQGATFRMLNHTLGLSKTDNVTKRDLINQWAEVLPIPNKVATTVARVPVEQVIVALVSPWLVSRTEANRLTATSWLRFVNSLM